MSDQEERIPGDWGFWQWILLGICGIVLALAIALAAGSLARQPVGLSGEPVSAGSALDPGPSTQTATGREGRKADSGKQSTGASTVPPANVVSPDTSVPPVSSPPSNVQSSPPSAAEGGSDEGEASSGDEGGGEVEDD